MTDLNTGITIDVEYEGGEPLAEIAHTTTSPALLPPVPGGAIRRTQPSLRPEDSPASMLQAYVEHVATEPSDAILAYRGVASEPADQARSARNATAIALLEKWLADDTSYDEDTWPALQQRIEESRTSRRRRFSE